MGDPVIKKLICDDFVEAFARRCSATAETLSPRVLDALTALDEMYLSYGTAILFEYDQKAMEQIPEPYRKE